jgi:DNA replication initiation complex subunit (GINS family)
MKFRGCRECREGTTVNLVDLYRTESSKIELQPLTTIPCRDTESRLDRTAWQKLRKLRLSKITRMAMATTSDRNISAMTAEECKVYRWLTRVIGEIKALKVTPREKRFQYKSVSLVVGE